MGKQSIAEAAWETERVPCVCSTISSEGLWEQQNSVTSAPIQLLGRPQCTPPGFSCLCLSPAQLWCSCVTLSLTAGKELGKASLGDSPLPLGATLKALSLGVCICYRAAVPVPGHAPH